jgi:aspartate aminotransferase
VIIINSPNNPTGAIIPPQELQAIAEVIDRHDLILVSDDIYASLNFSSDRVESIVAYVKNQDRILSIGGASKTYAMPGLRIGWAVGGLKLIARMRDVLSQTVSCVSGPAQAAAMAAIRGDQGFLNEVRITYRARAEMVVSGLREMPGVQVLKPKGAFYALADFSDYVGTRYKGQLIRHTKDLAHFLLTEGHVAVVPGEAFHAPGFLRISFATNDEVISKGLERIAGFLSELSR